MPFIKYDHDFDGSFLIELIVHKLHIMLDYYDHGKYCWQVDKSRLEIVESLKEACRLGDLILEDNFNTPAFEIMDKLWKVLDSFPIERAEWHPYFKNGVAVSNKNANFSFYKCEKKLLCFVSNMKKEVTITDVTLPFKVKTVKDVFSGELVSVDTDSFSLSVSSFGSRILTVDI